MQLRRARRLSSEGTMYQGANSVSVASNMMSRAREYSNHLLREHRSVGLSFHWRRGSSMRASKRRFCCTSLTSSQNLMSRMPSSTMYLSNSGQVTRKRWCCSSVQKPMTYSMPARLYQLRSKITISPAAGKRRRQRHHAEHARADAVNYGLDGATLAGGVAALEHHDHPQPLLLDPVLQRAQFDLQSTQRLLVFLAFHRFMILVHWLPLLFGLAWDYDSGRPCVGPRQAPGVPWRAGLGM